MPGGSGGGTAAAVSGGLAPWALGSDTGGSIKQPSALCGNVGLRPTYGTVSRFGIVAFASSLDQIGPGREDRPRLALLYSIIAGRDAARLDHGRAARAGRAADGGDLTGAAHRRPDASSTRPTGIEPGVARAFEAARRARRELGAEVGECDLPLSVEYGMACYYLIAPAEASSNLARYDGVRYGPRVDGADATGRCTSARATPASATSRSGGSCSARTRSRPATTTRTTARRRRCARCSSASIAPRSSSFDVLVDADVADGRVPDRRPGRRPARDVRLRPADDPVLPRRAARPQHPVRPLRGAPGRAAADRPAVRRERALPRRPRARAGDRLRTSCPERLR